MLEKVSSLKVGVGAEVAVGLGVGVADGVEINDGVGVADGVGVGVGLGVGVRVGVGVGVTFNGVPLLQTKPLPDFIQVNFKPLLVLVKPCFVHFVPGFGALAAATGNICAIIGNEITTERTIIFQVLCI